MTKITLIWCKHKPGLTKFVDTTPLLAAFHFIAKQPSIFGKGVFFLLHKKISRPQITILLELSHSQWNLRIYCEHLPVNTGRTCQSYVIDWTIIIFLLHLWRWCFFCFLAILSGLIGCSSDSWHNFQYVFITWWFGWETLNNLLINAWQYTIQVGYHYPLDNPKPFHITYLPDSDVTTRWHYPTFEQLAPAMLR